jgi:hypothetical protein
MRVVSSTTADSHLQNAQLKPSTVGSISRTLSVGCRSERRIRPADRDAGVLASAAGEVGRRFLTSVNQETSRMDRLAGSRVHRSSRGAE